MVYSFVYLSLVIAAFRIFASLIMVVEMVQNSTFKIFIHVQHLKILFMFNIYSFIFNICLIYSALILFKIQHLYLYSTVLFVHKIIIHSETIFPFNNFLFIQDLLRISLTHGSGVLLAANEKGAVKKCKRSLELKRYRPLLHCVQ